MRTEPADFREWRAGALFLRVVVCGKCRGEILIIRSSRKARKDEGSRKRKSRYEREGDQRTSCFGEGTLSILDLLLTPPSTRLNRVVLLQKNVIQSFYTSIEACCNSRLGNKYTEHSVGISTYYFALLALSSNASCKIAPSSRSCTERERHLSNRTRPQISDVH